MTKKMLTKNLRKWWKSRCHNSISVAGCHK